MAEQKDISSVGGWPRASERATLLLFDVDNVRHVRFPHAVAAHTDFPIDDFWSFRKSIYGGDTFLIIYGQSRAAKRCKTSHYPLFNGLSSLIRIQFDAS